MESVGLTFLYSPVRELGPTVAFYRDVLDWVEAWSEGDETVAFQVPGSSVQVMVSIDHYSERPGPMYRVPDLDAFLAARPELVVIMPPRGIPGGRVVSVSDGGGNSLYFFEYDESAG